MGCTPFVVTRNSVPLNNAKFGHMTVSKIVKIVATGCHIAF